MVSEILIIDDSIEICTALGAILGYSSLPHKIFHDPIDALQYFEVEKNPVVLLDIYLPSMNGVDVLKKIKEINPTTVVIMMTGERDIQSVISCLKNNAGDFLLKPFSTASVKQSINKALDYHNLYRQKENYRMAIENDLKFASKIQRKVLCPSIEKENLYIDFHIQSQVFSDFYSIRELTPNNSFIILGDTEGKGISSGFVGLVVIHYFRDLLEKTQSPAQLLSLLNNVLIEKINTHTVTAVCISIDQSEKKAVFSIAGMPYPHLFSVNGHKQIKPEHTEILGIIPNVELTEISVQAQKGNFLLLHSNGFIAKESSVTTNYYSQLIASLDESAISENPFESAKANIRKYVEYCKQANLFSDDVSFILIGF